ncbi:MAG TPA: NADH-quinone oxidoreductase subunit L [Bacteroidia bacterium]|nr:NADH-quinone oxidoreductase subunit L [Bacteroidia bacterium]
MLNFIWLIPLLPLLGFAINGLLNKSMPRNLVGVIACGTMFISFIISCGLFFQLMNGANSFEVELFKWIQTANFNLGFSFLVDRISAIMLLVVTGVGFLIHVYSIGYMHHDEDYPRFMSYLNLFVFFMLLLVMGNNYVLMFAGWEGVGLCSYLLIGFWFKNNDYNNAANKAFIMNRIGDLGFLLGMFLCYQTFGSLNYKEVFEAAKNFPSGDATIVAITLLFFVGAIGKSAQIPLYTWLPDAMAGPTPVSALIHAATMVTAGVYMIVRSNVLYTLAPFSQEIVLIIGVATAIFAATIGLKQNDIKKVLAYSTVSQLGYMFAAAGVGAYSTAMFHLVTHAFFKALLFLCAGSVIHAMSGEQDIRKMGGLKKYLSTTHFTFLMGVLAISGVPVFAGFFSKDEILAVTHNHSMIAFSVLSFASVLTACYMFRLYWLTFHGEFRGTNHQREHLHESPSTMTIPLIVLAILSTIGGFIGLPELFSEPLHTHHAFNTFLAPAIYFYEERVVSHSFEITLLVTSIIVLVIIYIATKNYYITKATVPESDEQEKGFAKILSHKYYVDELYDNIIRKPLYAISKGIYSFIEKNIIDGIVNAVPKVTNAASSGLRLMQTGSIGFYVFGMVVGIILMFVLKFML